MAEKVVLYSYWRSSCSWRVRICLHWKEIDFVTIPVNLLESEQQSPEYVQKNPSKSVPTLMVGEQVLTQSIAILEFLEEHFGDAPKLLPSTAIQRALVETSA